MLDLKGAPDSIHLDSLADALRCIGIPAPDGLDAGARDSVLMNLAIVLRNIASIQASLNDAL